jgi:hypothetical protein
MLLLKMMCVSLRFSYWSTLTVFLGSLLLLPGHSIAQQVTINGKVTDGESGDPIPFANVLLKSSGTGMTTDFDGLYRMEISRIPDTLIVSYVGYQSQQQAIATAGTVEINFRLLPDVVNLQEIVVYAGENPAFEILRRLDRNRKLNDPRSLEAYDYESYSKTEIDLNQLPEKSKQDGLLKKVTDRLDEIQGVTDESGNTLIPIYLSETISRFYVRNSPVLKRENIIRSQVKGVGLSADSWLSQLSGSAFQQYNFYYPYINLVGKSFISPIAANGKLFYDYELSDSLYLGEDYCYRLDFFPRRKQDLAFQGSMWITRDAYALRQIDVQISRDANLNYIEKIRIQQEMAPVENTWIPAKTRVLIDSEEFGQQPGLLLKFYSSNRDFVLNNEQKSRFYETSISLLENAYTADEAYWNTQRHESLSENELQVLAIIDTINHIPAVRTYVGFIDALASGYKSLSYFDLGHYFYTYANNSLEGHRIRLGGRTNSGFSQVWTLRAYAAYGTKDRRFKYGMGTDYILRRSPWSTVSVDYAHDIGQVGFDTEALQEGNEIFLTASFFGDLEKAYRYDRSSISLFQQLPYGLSSKASFRYQWFDPLFNFAYLEKPSDQLSLRDGRFTTSEASLTVRFARDEQFVQQGNRRISLGTIRWPVVEMKYTLGLKGVLGSDFAYQKLEGNLRQNLKMGAVGTSTYQLAGAYTFDALPYPLLNIHLGNEGAFYSSAAFSTMLTNEFVSDHFMSLRYQHAFQGFLLNRIPLMQKLKWRSLATANMLYGGMRAENISLMADMDMEGNSIIPFSYLGDQPFVEVGYGIENIFKIIRIDAFHRLTYLDQPNIKKFRVMVSLQLIL